MYMTPPNEERNTDEDSDDENTEHLSIDKVGRQIMASEAEIEIGKTEDDQNEQLVDEK